MEGRLPVADRDTVGAQFDMGEALGFIVMWMTGSDVDTRHIASLNDGLGAMVGQGFPS